MTDDSVGPPWFTRAVGTAPIVHRVATPGATVAVRAWGDPGAPGVVLLHGGAAHASWWDPVAPLLLPAFRVLAPDLSGHGDSDRRPQYSLARWADEVEAVLSSGLAGDRAVVVGHSMGGYVAATTALRAGDSLAGTVLLDSEIAPAGRTPTRPTDIAGRIGPARVHPRRQDLLRRFRLLPADADVPGWMSAYIAERSVMAVDGGWTWKFDPTFFAHDFLHLEDLHPVACPVAVAHGEHGLVGPAAAAETARLLGSTFPVVQVHASGHHVLLEQPLQVAALVAALAGAWTADGTFADPRPRGVGAAR